MPRSQKKVIQSPTTSPDAEMWTIVQVSSFLRLSYQTARNNMLVGDYGESSYDPVTRKLTVSADRVRAVKSRRGRKPKKKPRDECS